MKPIRPEEVIKAKQAMIPDAVFEAFNELIAERWNGHNAVISQPALVSLIRLKMDRHNADISGNGWLDVEDIYREAGWVVQYEKPGYNESGEAYFTFSKPKG